MSFSIFKASMISYMSNQSGVISSAQFANKLTTEYDMCIRRGYQTTNKIPIQTANIAGMLTLTTLACQKAFTVQQGPHNFIDDIGKAVLTYWTGAKLVVGIPPIIPADGAVTNISTTSAIVTNPGQWTSFGPESPSNNSNDFLSILISGMQQHITTISGLYITISIYPSFPAIPPAPGIRTWTGWDIP
jgi:hypothetical protein